MKAFRFDRDLETLKAFNAAADDAQAFGAFLRKNVFLDVEEAA